MMSSRNWTSGVEKLEKSEESEAGKAASWKSSLAGARILGAPGSHVQPEPRRKARRRRSAAPEGGRGGCLPDASRFHPGHHLGETRGCDSARASPARSPR